MGYQHNRNARIEQATRRIIEYKYPPELATVILDDDSLPAFHEAYELAEELYDLTFDVRAMEKQVEEAERLDREKEDRYEEAQRHSDAANDELQNIRNGIAVQKKIRYAGVHCFEDILILEDEDFTRDYLEWDY